MKLLTDGIGSKLPDSLLIPLGMKVVQTAKDLDLIRLQRSGLFGRKKTMLAYAPTSRRENMEEVTAVKVDIDFKPDTDGHSAIIQCDLMSGDNIIRSVYDTRRVDLELSIPNIDSTAFNVKYELTSAEIVRKLR